MAIPNATITKNIALAADGWRRTAYPDGSVPNAGPTAPPTFATSKTSSSITATITNANGATSYNVRVDAGTAVSGLTISDLTEETTYSFQVQGVNEFGSSDWSDGVPITTSAVPSGSWTEGVAPSISAVSGSFVAGQTATITVSNLSTKRNGQMFFVDFEGEAAGQVVTSIQHADLDPAYAKYVAETQTPLFGTKYARCHPVQNRPDQAGLVFDASYREVFFEGWLRYQTPDFTDPSDAQIKFWRMVPYSTIAANAQNETPVLTWTREDGNGFLLLVSPGPGGQATWYGTTPTTNTWMPWSAYMNLGDPNTANGKIYAKVGTTDSFTFSGYPSGHAASTDGSISASEWDGNEYLVDDGTLSGELHRLLVPYYTRSAQETILDVDRIYVNDSPERVVVGDASVFTACTATKRFILKQNVRAGGQIEVDIDSLGPLSSGPVYLYVFNQDGLCNEAGYLWRAA